MDPTLAEALLRAIVESQESFFEAAELVSLGAITQERYQSAADRFHDSIDRAAACLPPAVETRRNTPTVETGAAAMRRDVLDAYAEVGADARVDCDNFETLTVDQLRDELVYLADYQG